MPLKKHRPNLQVTRSGDDCLRVLGEERVGADILRNHRKRDDVAAVVGGRGERQWTWMLMNESRTMVLRAR